MTEIFMTFKLNQKININFFHMDDIADLIRNKIRYGAKISSKMYPR